MSNKSNMFTTLNHFSWKQIMLFNMLILFSGFGLLTQHFVNTPTRTTSKAAPPAPVATPAPNYPTALPKLQQIYFFYAKPLDTVRVKGANLGTFQWGSTLTLSNATSLSPNSTALTIPSTHILQWSDDYIDIVIPENAKSGYLTLLRGDGEIAQTPYPLVIYKQSTDPHLVLNNNGVQQQIILKNAPQNSLLTLELAPNSQVQSVLNTPQDSSRNTYTFSVNNSNDLYLISGFNIDIEHASLSTQNELLLPLYVRTD